MSRSVVGAGLPVRIDVDNCGDGEGELMMQSVLNIVRSLVSCLDRQIAVDGDRRGDTRADGRAIRR
jgi:hypothetical protein